MWRLAQVPGSALALALGGVGGSQDQVNGGDGVIVAGGSLGPDAGVSGAGGGSVAMQVVMHLVAPTRW